MATINGEPASAEQLLALAGTNYGHYTSMRATGSGARGFSHHMHRLSLDCRRVFGVDLDLVRVREFVAQQCQSRTGDYGVRVTIFDPSLGLGRPADAQSPAVLVERRPAPPLPASPIRAQLRHYSRDLPAVKHVGLFGAIEQRRAAQLAGFDDALFVEPDDTISEGPTWNVGFFDGQNVVWPDAECLPGVTMTLLRQVHDDTVVQPVKLTDLAEFEAAFATNVTVGVRPIANVNEREFPVDHPIFETLSREFEEIPLEDVQG